MIISLLRYVSVVWIFGMSYIFVNKFIVLEFGYVGISCYFGLVFWVGGEGCCGLLVEFDLIFDNLCVIVLNVCRVFNMCGLWECGWVDSLVVIIFVVWLM